METYLSDNAGNRVPPADAPDSVIASGQTLTNGLRGTNTLVTVVAGAKYVFTAQETGGFYLGIADVANTPANIIWACPIYQTIIIVVPTDISTLHYAVDIDNAVGYLRRLTD